MGIVSKIFGSEKIIEGGLNGLDKIILTDEEKIDAKLSFLKLYEPFKLAQRLLAWLFSSVFLGVYLLAVTIWMMGAFTENLDRAGFLMAIALELAEWNTNTLGTAISLIIGFYFASGFVEGSIVKYNKKAK